MKLNNKIEAFTLSELVVVMILTTVVVGLAFSTLNLVQKHMSSIRKNYNSRLELNKLETALWLDFNRYSKVIFSQEKSELKFLTELDSTVYKFSQDLIITRKDTFNIQLENKQLYFNGELSSNGKIDAIKLGTTKSFQNQKIFVFKSNDATVHIN